MRAGEFSARELAQRYLERIERLDREGAKLRAVIEVNPEALEIADALDRRRRESGPIGPLHGIPVLIKDNIDTADRMGTTAGSLALDGSRPPRDAFLVARLRESGAVLLGKANLSEWANFRSSRSTSGWSARGRQTKNPYALDRNPCGSSSGSAVAASANLCAAAVGTETDGSIVCPSSINGLVGVKPTLGLVSRSGIIPIAHSQDTAGPMARTVTDAAILLGALTGPDPRDPASVGAAPHARSDYTSALDPGGLRNARIGVVRGSFGFHPKVDVLMEDALRAMREGGATLVDPVEIPTSGQFDDSELEVLLYEFKADLEAYLRSLGPAAPVRTLAEIIEFNERNAEREMPWFGQDLFVRAEAKGPLTSREYLRALRRNRRLSGERGIDRVLHDERLDALVAPTAGPAWPTDWINGDHYSGGYSSPSAVAGYPHVTVPAGFVFGLPVGASFFGAAFSEPTLLGLAYAFERATAARRPPRFAAHADFGGGG